MKLFAIFALVVATVSAGSLGPQVLPLHPKDLPVIEAPEGRITNGKDAAEGQFPHQVGLSFSGSAGGWWCGGSLIDAEWILTAAHCTSGASSVTAFLGATIRTNPKQTVTVQSNNFRQHENYNSIVLRNDISLIKIPPVTLTNLINKIAIPKISNSYSSYAGATATASGWGKISDDATGVANHLQYTPLTVITNAVCQQTYGSLIITDGVICTATPSATSTCNGDSGGPLALNGQVIGVTSFVSSAGCQSGAPAGFTRVTKYLPWIKEKSGVVG